MVESAFRVSGKYRNFESEGPELLKKSRGRNVITIDFSIPESCLLDSGKKELGLYVSEGVRECFNLLKEKASKQKEICDENELDHAFDNGMKLFLEFVDGL